MPALICQYSVWRIISSSVCFLEISSHIAFRGATDLLLFSQLFYNVLFYYYSDHYKRSWFELDKCYIIFAVSDTAKQNNRQSGVCQVKEFFFFFFNTENEMIRNEKVVPLWLHVKCRLLCDFDKLTVFYFFKNKNLSALEKQQPGLNFYATKMVFPLKKVAQTISFVVHKWGWPNPRQMFVSLTCFRDHRLRVFPHCNTNIASCARITSAEVFTREALVSGMRAYLRNDNTLGDLNWSIKSFHVPI